MEEFNELQRSETTTLDRLSFFFVRGRGCPVSWGLPMPHLRRWEFTGELVGIGLTRVVTTLAVILAPFHPHSGSLTRSALPESSPELLLRRDCTLFQEATWSLFDISLSTDL